MTRPFHPARRISDTVIAERLPIALEGVARFRGVEFVAGGARRVIVREPNEHTDGEEHFLDAFQQSIAQQLALAGTVAPQVLHVLGREPERGLAVVEEALAGAPLDGVLRGLRTQGRELPVEAALAIAAALVGLWRIPDERGLLVPMYLSPRDLLITASGEIRATPQLASERARQVAGAMVMPLDPDVAYLSPEQVEGNYGSASGMFTLGLILHELLATAHAIAGIEDTPMMETLTRLRDAAIPSILECRLVPPRVVAFLARLLAREPRARFETWDHLLVELDAVHGDLPPCGAADLLAALPEPPRAPPPLELAALGAWQALPHEGLAPITVALATGPRRTIPLRPALARDYHYGADARPMLAHGDLLVDVRPVSEAELARFALATGRTSFSPAVGDVAATQVSFAEACAYAAWAGKRLPSEAEWTSAVAALGAERLGVGEVWEWTTTPQHGGQVVCGGRWRNLDRPPRPDNRSYETGPAADVGFRCVAPFTR